MKESFHSYGGNGRKKLHHHKYGKESQENQRRNFLFGTENILPVTIIAESDCGLWVISRESILSLIENDKAILRNFLTVLSDHSLFLSRKLEQFALQTLSSRLMGYLENNNSIQNLQQTAFILGVAGLAVFHSLQAGLLLWGCHVLASLCTGLLFRFYGSSSPRRLSPVSSEKAMPFSHALVESVTSAISSLLNVCAFVLFFGLCIGLLEQMGITEVLLSLLERLGVSRDFAAPILSGSLEMTTGIWGLSEVTGALPLRLSAAAFLLAFGGLSVHFQSLSFLTSSGLSAAPYFMGKITHGALSALFTYIAALRLPPQTAAASGLFFQASPSSLSPLSIFLFSSLLCLILWLLTGLRRGKWGKNHCHSPRKPV